MAGKPASVRRHRSDCVAVVATRAWVIVGVSGGGNWSRPLEQLGVWEARSLHIGMQRWSGLAETLGGW